MPVCKKKVVKKPVKKLVKKSQKVKLIGVVRIKSKKTKLEDLPDFGLGHGILRMCELTVSKKAPDPVLAFQLIELGEKMINDSVEVVWRKK